MTSTFIQKVAWEDIKHILYLKSDIHALIEVIFHPHSFIACSAMKDSFDFVTWEVFEPAHLLEMFIFTYEICF